MDFDGYNIYIVYKMRYNITGGYILKYANFLYVACSAESTESTWHCTDVASLSRVTPRLLLLSSGKRLQLAIENHHVYPFLMDKSTINSYVSFGPSIEVNFFTEIDDEGDQIDDDHVSAAQKCPSIRRRRIDEDGLTLAAAHRSKKIPFSAPVPIPRCTVVESRDIPSIIN